MAFAAAAVAATTVVARAELAPARNPRSETPPTAGWRAVAIPTAAIDAPADASGRRAAWLRVRFDASGGQPLALGIAGPRERVLVLLNGIDVHRSFRGDDDAAMGWNRTYAVPLPRSLVRPTGNMLLIRIDSQSPWLLASGRLRLGPSTQIAAWAERRGVLESGAPRVANIVMLAIALFSLLLWLVRRHERDLLWLAALGVAWLVRDLHFILDAAPIEPMAFFAVTVLSFHVAVPLTFAFCAEFFRLPDRAAFIRLSALVAAVSSAIAAITLAPGGTNVPAAATAVTSVYALYAIARLARRAAVLRTLEYKAAVLFIALNLAANFVDFARAFTREAFPGFGFYWQPFTGLAITLMFILALGRRYAVAARAAETESARLEAAIAATRAELARSEAARRAAEVAAALAGERQRLMREIHDGIGANLVTAIAIADGQRAAPAAAVLRRAHTDLKLTVDSLEPFESDLPALLGNLRYRLAPDLKAAGVTLRWASEPCPPLAWLDAAAALHALRLFQEAIANSLSHAQAATLHIGCRPSVRRGAPGVLAWVADDGIGFAPADVGKGHGVAGMASRARALGCVFTLASRPGHGTRIRLWLPCRRD